MITDKLEILVLLITYELEIVVLLITDKSKIVVLLKADKLYIEFYWWLINLFPNQTLRKVGKAGSHKPYHFPLPCHILPFLSSGNLKPQSFGLQCQNIWVFRQLLCFQMVKILPWNCVLQNPATSNIY